MLVGKRTILFNLAASAPVLAEIAVQLLLDPSVKGVIPVEYLPLYAVAVAFGNIVLRALTTTPIGVSKKAASEAVEAYAERKVAGAAKAVADEISKQARQARKSGH